MKTYKEEHPGISKNNRSWSRIYGIVSGVSLMAFGLIIALLSPGLGVATSIAGLIIAIYTAVYFKKA